MTGVDSDDYPDAKAMAQLEGVLDALAEGRSYRPTLNGMIRDWRALVEQVETGYDWSIYEYFNDLHVRAMLQSVIDGAPGLRGWVEVEVAPLDERFRAATRSLLNYRPRRCG